MTDSPRCRVVLVRPHFAGNLGSVARIMANFGFRDLVLVEPIVNPTAEEAIRMATHGRPVLESARTVPTLRDALADCVATMASGGLIEGVERQTVTGTPEEKLPFLIESCPAGPTALVFGPEPHGLTTAEIGLCHGMIHMPTFADCPSINLSHAVAICLYEWTRLVGTVSPIEARDLAVHAELDRLFDHLKKAFEAIHYIFGSKADQLMHGFRHVIGRARPTKQDVRLLHGLARQILYIAGKHNGDAGEVKESEG